MNNRYTKTHDIDWFYLVSGIPIHVASAGGQLPNSINSLQRLHVWQRDVDLYPRIAKVLFNKDYVLKNIIEKDYEHFNADLLPQDIGVDDELLQESDLSLQEKMYYNTFFSMTRLGFYSFDRTLRCDGEIEFYHLVTKPDRVSEDLVRRLLKLGVPSVYINEINWTDDMDKLNNLQLVEMINNG